MGNNSSSQKPSVVESKSIPCEKKIKASPNVDTVSKLPILKYDESYFFDSNARIKTPKRIKKTKPLTKSEKKERRTKLLKKRENRQQRNNYASIMRQLFTQRTNPAINKKLAAAKELKKQQKKETKKEKKRKKDENKDFDNIMMQNDDYLFDSKNEIKIKF